MTKKLLQSGILVLLILSISGCHKKNPDTIESLSEASVSASDETDAADSSDSSADVSSEEETLETTETETELVPETTRVSSENLPDTAIYNDTVLDNYTLTIDAAQRFTINYPKDFSVIIAMKYTPRIRSRMPCTVCPIQLMEKTIPSPSSIGIL